MPCFPPCLDLLALPIVPVLVTSVLCWQALGQRWGSCCALAGAAVGL